MCTRVIPAVAVLLCLGWGTSALMATPRGTAITYQGQLKQSGVPYSGPADLAFTLYDAAAAGNIVAGPILLNGVNVVNGLFTVSLDFGASAFDASARWLEIQVGDPLTLLSPRQELTCTPFALQAADLDMPFSGTSDAATQTVFIANTGTGKAGYFAINNAANPSTALAAATNGTGDAISGVSLGTGRAGYFLQGGPTISPALDCVMAAGGPAVRGYCTSTSGSAGWFQIHFQGFGNNNNDALHAETNGQGSAIYAVATAGGNAVEARASGGGFSHAGSFVVDCGPDAGEGEAVWVSTNSDGEAVSAYTSGRSSAGYFVVNNAANGVSALYGQTNGTGQAVRGYVTGNAWAGYFTAANGSAGKGVYISVPAGNAGLNVASGTKNAVVATSSGARLLYSEESTEVWFTDYGFGRLQGGRAKVTIDPTFAETVDLAQPYHVFVQLNDFDSAGVGVANKTPVSFEVGELRGGTSNAEFSYRIVAKRRAYEKSRLERAPYADEDENLYAAKARGSDGR
jgi:hypothetical protein